MFICQKFNFQNPNENKKSKTNYSSKPGAHKISSWDYSAWDKFDVVMQLYYY